MVRYVFCWMKIIVFSSFLSFCNNSNESNSDAEYWIRNEIDPPVAIQDYITISENEKLAYNKIKQYFNENRFDSLYLIAVVHIQKDNSEEKYNEELNCIGFEFIHQNSIDFWVEHKKKNERLAKEYEGEEWVPIIPPPTGNISGKDRTIFYYFEGDSIVDILSQ